MKRNCSEAAHSSFWLSSDSMKIENKKKVLWGSPEQILIEIQLKFNWWLQQTALGQEVVDSDFAEPQNAYGNFVNLSFQPSGIGR